MKSFISFQNWPVLLAALILPVLAGCNLPAAGPPHTPTLDVTHAYQTVQARLTEAISLTPNPSTPVPTAVGRVTENPTQVTPATTTPTASSPTPSTPCDQAAPGAPIDVTIPDDTEMQPGQDFTKIWRLQNAGTCTWTKDYALVWFSGEQLGAPSGVPLSGNVTPGQSVDLAVDMVAPEDAGTYQSNWKLRNASSVLFGIGPSGGAPFWVRIIVVRPPTRTPAPTVPPTPMPTLTPTTPAQASGPVTLAPGDVLDLDTNQVNSGDEDLAYQTSEQKHILVPQGTAIMVVFGNTQPDLPDCQNAALSAAPVTVEDSLAAGTYLCYRTNMALPGRAQVSEFDPSSGALNLDIYTWAIP